VTRGAGELVLGVDTVVALDGRLWGKPATEADARATLHALSGRTHTVVSGVVLAGEGSPRTATAATQVSFRALAEPEIEWYMAVEEWRERAGGYAIQGAGCALVATIAGDWTNVVGLPVATLLALYPALLAQHPVHDHG
jgi:nucleoside triphosphate pyrophosphatase